MTSSITNKQESEGGRLKVTLDYLVHDKTALAASLLLAVFVIGSIAAPLLVRDQAIAVNLLMRNHPPFNLEKGWQFVLGADTLGRPILLRLLVGGANTLGIAVSAVMFSMFVGGALGLVVGYFNNWFSAIILRLTDIIMSFPSLLLALVVLYALGPSLVNLVVVLAVTRIPIYLRTTRAEVLEIRQRVFVNAARALGASSLRIVIRHVAPMAMPTLITIAAIDFATVILAESALSFLGLGIQPPEFTWGAMVASGRGYLASAWWISFWPGLTIILATLSLNLLANWARVVADPSQRWRVQKLAGAGDVQ